MKKTFKEWLQTAKKMSDSDIEDLDADETAKLHAEYYNVKLKALKESQEDGAKAVKTLEKAVETLKEDAKKYAGSEKMIEIEKNLDEAIKTLDELKDGGGRGSGSKMKSIRALLTEKKSLVDKLKENHEGTIKFEVAKASHNSDDINSGEDYAEMESGTNRKPFRKFSILDTFRRRPINKEFLKYREEDVVTRDGKVVVKCATSTHNTKKTWIVRSTEVGKVRDMTDICIDMLDDYDFVEGEIKELVEQGVTSREEIEIFNGTGDILSIDTIASEFAHGNVLAPFTNKFQDANLEQLADAMAGQIAVFGQENKWQCDTLLMNYTDFIVYRNLKDKNGNKLIHTLSDKVATIAGMMVVTSPLVASNECYVYDSEQAVILDRKAIAVDMFYENKDNAEHEMVTVKAVKRLQFHVKNIDRDAFMKCTDITQALEDISKA